MSNTILEQTRGKDVKGVVVEYGCVALHEDIEKCERLAVKDMKRDALTHQEKLFQGHRICKLLETTEDRAAKLVHLTG